MNGHIYKVIHKIGIILFFSIVFICITEMVVAKPSTTLETDKNRKPNSSDNFSSDKWKFTGDGKKSPISGVKWKKSGYQCFVVSNSGTKKTIESNISTNVGKMAKATDKALGIKAYKKDTIVNIGKNIPVYRVNNAYDMTCYIWIDGKVLSRQLKDK